MTRTNLFTIILFFCIINLCCVCTSKDSGGNNPPGNPPATPIETWLSRADPTVLLQKQSSSITMNSPSNTNAYIDVDSAVAFQTIDGFGYTLTGGSAYLLNRMGSSERSSILSELFGNGSNSIGVS